MPNDAARIDSMLFDYKTTHHRDYKTIKFEPIIKSMFREKKRVRAPYKHIKDIRTLVDWRGPQMAFDLLWGWSPKPIIRTDPRNVQKPFAEEPETLGQKEAQRTRPRLVMTPAISMDDIDDDELRQLLVEDMYRPTALIAAKEGVARVAFSKIKNVRAPFPGRNASANPVYLERAKPSRVPLEWRRDTISWDYNQLRTHIAPEREFWLRQGNLYKDCLACKQTAQVKETRDMAKLLPK